MAMIKIGIPVHRERDWLPATLKALAAQKCTGFEVWICVNQPAEYQGNKQYSEITAENIETMNWLKREDFPFPIRIIDAVSKACAPTLKAAGVGWARRRLFDEIVAESDDDTICISLDADTRTLSNYIHAVRAGFAAHPNAVGLAIPYYHGLPEEPEAALHLLRYEIYMRYYQINLWRIGSPYAFLPLGSAMAFKASAYRAVGGIPRRKAAEDFYFLQQLRKIGPIIRWVNTRVFPAPRPSARVPFGTGPLMMEKSLRLQEQRFPFYPLHAFDLLGKTFREFASLYEGGTALAIDDFIVERMKGYRAFDRIRKNFAREDLFVKACHERLDALKTLQFLKFFAEREPANTSDLENLAKLMKRLGRRITPVAFDIEHLGGLNEIRNTLAECEADYQKEYMAKWDFKAKW